MTDEASESWMTFDPQTVDKKLEQIASSNNAPQPVVAKAPEQALEKPKSPSPSEENNEVERLLKANPRTAPPEKKMTILKRDPSKNSVPEKTPTKSSPPVQEKSLAQREKEYQEARDRIFASKPKK